MRKRYQTFVFLLISLLTFLLAQGFGLTETNFSVIGNKEGRKVLLLIWGAFVGNFCFLYMDDLMRMTFCTDKIVQSFLLASLYLLVIGIGLPYLPKKVPLLSKLHVIISFLAPVAFWISQFRFLSLLQRKKGKIWREQWCLQIILASGSFFLLFSYGMVTSLLEIFLTLGMCLYLWLLQRKLEKFQEIL